jgi:hypothetical protein
MPDIPNVPGVPSLTDFAPNALSILTTDLISFALGGLEIWGVYLLGIPVLPNMKSFVTFEYRKDWNIPDYPFESGAFQSYNKVQLPFEARVRITAKSSLSDRQLLLAEIETVAASTALYTIVTPERTFLNCSVSHFDVVKRSNSNAGLLIVDLWFIEIRSNTLANLLNSFLDTLNPTNAAAQGLGNIQPVAVASSFDEAGFSGAVT